ncbi:hypothetical protein Hdeb2414_s0053g00754151 [Helianthus debilis subsp. tardiflorus]
MTTPAQSSTTIPSITVESKIHPATTVSNIKNLVPIVLEIESSQYASWATLFKLHCKTCLVEDHLQPRPPPPDPTQAEPSHKPMDDWDRLDAIVLQWIYSTISNDLLHTIINNTSNAHEAWVAIEGLFHDNKSARAIHLMSKFSNTRLDGFPSMTAYCQALKVLADQLANVNAPVDNDRLVLQLLAGLNDQYEGISTILKNQDPLPSFYTARSKLIQTETDKAERASHAAKTASSALSATTSRNQNYVSNRPVDRSYGRGRGRSGRRGRGRGNYGRPPSPHTYWPHYPWYPTPSNPPSFWPTQNSPYPNPYSNTSAQNPTQTPPHFPWPNTHLPPCPYPNIRSPSQPTAQSQQNGILGPAPAQNNYAAYSPTDIEQAMYTMSLQQPDLTQYMDTGATSTMSHDKGPPDADSAPAMQQQR